MMMVTVAGQWGEGGSFAPGLARAHYNSTRCIAYTACRALAAAVLPGCPQPGDYHFRFLVSDGSAPTHPSMAVSDAYACEEILGPTGAKVLCNKVCAGSIHS